MAAKVKDDKKSFFAYVRSKLKSKVKPDPLVDSDGKVLDDLEGMCNEFNRYFSSVYDGGPQKYTCKQDHISTC